MKTIQVLSTSARQTARLGRQLARHLRKGDIVCLEGELGSGKTTLIKGVAQGLGISPMQVHSPTFVLMNVYTGQAGLSLYHFDLYRIESVNDINAIGYEEFLYGDGVAMIEWAERLGDLTPQEYLRIELMHKDEDQRLINLFAFGKRYHQVVEAL